MINIKQQKLFLLALLSTSFFLSCSRPLAQELSDSIVNNAKGAFMSENNPSPQFEDGAHVFYILSSQKIVAFSEKRPENFYVEGVIKENNFMPTTGVMGQGALATSGTKKGWLELSSNNFFPMESARAAETPFVKGYETANGFIPSDREVFSAPK